MTPSVVNLSIKDRRTSSGRDMFMYGISSYKELRAQLIKVI